LRESAASYGFRAIWKTPPEVVASAPGRANLMGGHIDYSGGPVAPFALPFRLAVAAAPAGSGPTTLVSEALGSVEIRPPFQREGDWADLARGVFWLADELGLDVRGRYYVESKIPVGSGLSSSAAFEMAMLAAIFELNSKGYDKKELALLGPRVENEFLGVQSGIMDQMASALGKKNKLVLIDCAEKEYRYVDWPESNPALWVIHTGISRTLASSEFNKRRKQCEAALEIINARSQKSYRFLAHVPEKVVHDLKDELGELLYKRAKHVAAETRRVYEFVEALNAEDFGRAGELLYEAHASSRDDYEVSCPELDLLVQMAKDAGALGARLTGAGFGGAVVFLVPGEKEAEFLKVPDGYRKETSKTPTCWRVWPSEGLRVERRARL